MTPESVRDAFKEFLTRHLRIDKWGVNFPDQIENPNQPPSIAREDPITEDLRIEDSIAGLEGPIWARIRLSYKVIFRFDAAYSYMQIPKSQAETLILKMLMLLRLEPECLNEEIGEVEASAKVTIAETEAKDWLLVYSFAFAPLFQAELDELDTLSTLMKALDPLGGVDLIPQEDQGEFSEPLLVGSNLEAFRVVAIVDGQLVYADHRNLAHAYAVVGILRGAVVTGERVSVLSEGPITNPDWSWIPNEPIFLGEDGYLTQTSPTTGFLQPLGQVILPQQIRFEMQQPFFFHDG